MKRWLVMSALFASACNWCVARGAKVKTPRGTKRIEDLQVGDEIIVADPVTMEQHVSVITVIRSAMRECGRLHFGSASLTVTSAHPLYDPRAKQWAPAGDWLLGVREEFVSEAGATRITTSERFVGVEEVFDLSVAHELHTFVADGVVVHNKPPQRGTCPQPAADGLKYEYNGPCECGPWSTYSDGAVVCAEDGTPACSCSGSDDMSWRTEDEVTDTALRDGSWWDRLEREGPRAVLRVEPWEARGLEGTLALLPGSPNVLHITEHGDGSSGFLARALPDGGQNVSGSLWFWKDGAFPRVLSLGEFVLLGVDDDSVWFQPALGAPRWVATQVPSRVWVEFNWSDEVQDDGGHRVELWLQHKDVLHLGFVEEGTGASLHDFYADGGVFSFGDAGLPRELVLGHRSGTDGGTGVLRVSGVTMNVW